MDQTTKEELQKENLHHEGPSYKNALGSLREPLPTISPHKMRVTPMVALDVEQYIASCGHQK